MSQFFEPWRAAPPKESPEAEAARNLPCPPDIYPEVWNRAAKKPDCVLIWGTGMVAESVSESFTTTDIHGKAVLIPVPGDRIIATIKPPISDQGVKADMIARRIVECVNAMEGIANPVAWVQQAKGRLRAKGVTV